MKSITIFLILAICVNLFFLTQSALIIKPLIDGSEDRGIGITDQEVSFIKARIIEVANVAGRYAEKNANNLEPILNAGLTGVWGVFILDRSKDVLSNVGIAVGQPVNDKYWQGEQFGPYQWTYAIWKQRN